MATNAQKLNSHPYLSATQFHSWMEHNLLGHKLFEVKKGKSLESRDLFHLQYGRGAIHVLIWSQMHGNEATATYSISDILLEIKTESAFWKNIAAACTLHFVPMLNPDGSERYLRQNALGSDLNREALKPTSPELLFLLDIQKKYSIQWAFNLHDQRDIFSVGHSPNPATISVLAPQSITEAGQKSRKRAQQLLSEILQHCSLHAQGYVARFNDEYYPRALGEYYQNQGIATILIECGGHRNDTKREVARAYCSRYLKQALEIISTNTETQRSIEKYEQCPVNAEALRNIIFRDVDIQVSENVLKTDIAFMKKRQVKDGQYQEKWVVSEVGDLRHLFGYREVLSPKARFTQKNDALLPECEVSLEHLPAEFLAYFENL